MSVSNLALSNVGFIVDKSTRHKSRFVGNRTQ